MSCRTLSTAVDIWLKYSHPLVGMLVTPSAAKSHEGWSLTFSEITPMGKFFQFCVEENLAIGIKRIRDLIGAPLVLSSLELSYPKPAHYKLYFKEFNCPITFGAAVTRLSVRSPSMNAPIKSYDSEHFQACLTHCEQLLRNISDNQPVASKIRNYLIRKPGMIPSVNEMAAILNFSPRKLSRILKNEHVTYQRLVNDYRRQLTEEYIRTSGLNNKEIAYLLGYEETKAFLAAFKSWTGLNMSDYRKSLTA
jgi:AraC-like DNA-binding protein